MKKYFTGSTLKIIAACCMLVDHIGQVVLKNGVVLSAPYSLFTDAQFSILLSAVNVCHMVGRIAFPIFCFLLVEGFLHTHSLKKYWLHLCIFALISEPIYDLANTGQLFSMEQQNVMFTWLLGLTVLIIIRTCKDRWPVSILAIGAGAYLSYLCHLDGWYYGILLIGTFYLFHDTSIVKYVVSIAVMYVCGLDFSIYGWIDPYFLTAVFSLLPVCLYNGERGRNLKYFFYMFYPLHLLGLFLIAAYLKTILMPT